VQGVPYLGHTAVALKGEHYLLAELLVLLEAMPVDDGSMINWVKAVEVLPRKPTEIQVLKAGRSCNTLIETSNRRKSNVKEEEKKEERWTF